MMSSITPNNKDVIALTPVQIIPAKDLHYLTIASVEELYVTYRIIHFKVV